MFQSYRNVLSEINLELLLRCVMTVQSNILSVTTYFYHSRASRGSYLKLREIHILYWAYVWLRTGRVTQTGRVGRSETPTSHGGVNVGREASKMKKCNDKATDMVQTSIIDTNDQTGQPNTDSNTGIG